MSKKIQSTYDEFVASLTPQQRKEFEDGYKELVVSEMLIAIMREDAISVRKLAEVSGISPTIIQGMKTGTRKNVTVQSLFKVLKGLGYSLVAEREGTRIPLDLYRPLPDATRSSSVRRK